MHAPSTSHSWPFPPELTGPAEATHRVGTADVGGYDVFSCTRPDIFADSPTR